MNLITLASRIFLYCVVLRATLSSTFSIQKETQYDFNNLKHKTLHHNNETDNDDKRNNDKYLHKNVDEIWEKNEIPTLKHNSVKIKNGTSNNNTEALDYADELFSYHRLLSESSNRILKTYESDSKRNELVNRNEKNPTDIVKKLGDAVIDLSLEDQDKVIYIPVYEQENPGNYNSVPNQQKIKQNNENQYKKAEIGKKIIGFIGVVLVGKNKEKNSASGVKHKTLHMPPTQNMKSVHQQHQTPSPNNNQHLSLGLTNNHNSHMKSVHQQHQTPSPSNYQHSSPGLTNNHNSHMKSVHQQHQTPSPSNYQHSSPGLTNNYNGHMKSVHQQHQTPSPNNYQHSSLGLTNNHNGPQNSVNDVKTSWNIPISEDQGWKISLVTPNSHGITPSHGLTTKDQVIWGSRHQESSKRSLRNLVPGQNVQLNQNKNMDDIMNTNFNSKLNIPNNRPIPENPLFPNRMRGNRMRDKSLNSPSMAREITNNNKKQYQTHKPQINSQNFDENKNQFKSRGYQMKSQNNDQIKTHMLDGNNQHFIPVIKHIIVQDNSLRNNYKFKENIENYSNQDFNNERNLLSLNQNQKYSPQDTSGFQNSYNNYGKRDTNVNNENINNLYNHHIQQKYSKISEGNTHINEPINQIQNPNFKSNYQNNIIDGYHKIKEENKNEINNENNVSNLGKRTNVFESKNADKSYQQSQYGLLPQQYSSNIQNAQDTDIDKAFKAASIYLNNQNNVGVQSRSFTPENIRSDSDPRYFLHRSKERNKNLDNIRPTTDQRYNALFHERNNNFNVVKMATIPTYREQNIKHRIPKFYSNFTYMNNIGSKNTNFSGKSFEVENGQFVTLPLDENSWKIIKKNNNSYELERSVPDPVSKTVPFTVKNNDQFHQHSFQNSPPNHGISPEYFDVKKAVFNGQQIKFLNNDMDLNPLYNSKEIYKIPSDRIQKQFPELKTNKQREETLLFSGFNNGGWIPSKTDDNNQKDRDLQQFSGAEKRFTDGNSKSESNLSRFTGKNKFNYDNSVNARIKNNNNEKNGALKNNSDKSEKKNLSNNSEVDGADPNGFGGESFW